MISHSPFLKEDTSRMEGFKVDENRLFDCSSSPEMHQDPAEEGIKHLKVAEERLAQSLNDSSNIQNSDLQEVREKQEKQLNVSQEVRQNPQIYI